MKSLLISLLLGASCVAVVAIAAESLPASRPGEVVLNPLIDYAGHREMVRQVEPLREKRRVSEADFLRMTGEKGTIMLDARSGPMFERLHIRGAVNLSFPDFNDASLAAVIPTKGTRVLIYCNNNFLGSPVAMVTKRAPTSLNISTYVALAGYGYTEIYELAPLLNVNTTVLPLEGSEVAGNPTTGRATP